MKINLLDPIDHYLVDEKYRDITAFGMYAFSYMGNFSVERFLTDFNYHQGLPQKLTLQIFRDEYQENGYYMEGDSYIGIKYRRNAPRKMENTFIHELVHLFLVEVHNYNPENDHDAIFWEYIRKFKRYYKKRKKEYEKN